MLREKLGAVMLVGNCGIGPYKSYEISVLFVFAVSV
jgi:hypothetical protein